LVALAIMTGLLFLTTGAAGATTTLKFHAHIDAYGQPTLGCGPAEWSSSLAGCAGSGYDGNAGTSPFKGKVGVGWCDNGRDRDCAAVLKSRFENSRTTRPALPAGYSREMTLEDVTYGSWIYGAVKMPNGPFVVLAGFIRGQRVVAQDPNKPVESDGGPLFLYVGHHGGGVNSQEYVFGFRGYLNY
jgi:hypothetical protein